MFRKPIFDAVRRLLGRGLRTREVAAIDAALGAAVRGEDFLSLDRVTRGPCLTVGAKGIALIKQFEGCARRRRDGWVEAYPDPGTGGAPWTIGWGATGPGIGPGTVWSQAACDARLENDLKRYAAEVAYALDGAPTSQNQFDALVGFHYNTGAIGRATLTKLHRAGDFASAEREFARWRFAGGRAMNGLVRRRKGEAALYRSQDTAHAPGSLPSGEPEPVPFRTVVSGMIGVNIMRNLILSAAAIALASGAAYADPGNGKGKDRGDDRRAQASAEARVKANDRGQARARADIRRDNVVERRAERQAETRRVAARQDDNRRQAERQVEARRQAERREDARQSAERREDAARRQQHERREDLRQAAERREDIRQRIDRREDAQRRAARRDNDDRRIEYRDGRRVVVVRDRDNDDRRFDFRRERNRGLINGCPPGLAKRGNGCMPPGLARAMERERRWDRRMERNLLGYRYRPRLYGLTNYYDDYDDDYRFYYDDGFLYRLNASNNVLGYIPLLGGALAIGNPWPTSYQSYAVPSYYADYYNLGAPRGYRYADNVLYRVNPENAAITAIAALLTGNDITVGQPMPMGYDVYNVPYPYRDRYYDTPQAHYRYSDGYVYRIDPTTQLVAAAIDLVV